MHTTTPTATGRHGKRADGTAVIQITIPKKLKAVLAKAAFRDNRSLAAYGRVLLTEHAAKIGGAK